MNQINKQLIIQKKIRKIRQDTIKKVKIRSPNNDLNKPVAFWTKPDRLLNEVGNELTIILRTRGCEWALGDNGGCSMCGYISDANIDDVNSQNIINQFDYAFQNSLDKIQNDSRPFIVKIFNSGSFLDDTEMPKTAREYIYKKI
ncbi:MAG: TIGR01210 family radical SAM protein, partial [Candidatus Lokiarchaeota archaeon]|nr:TIGR01210 family radical SAM protein [Candidatus Lokiarchaeota archaeon]